MRSAESKFGWLEVPGRDALMIQSSCSIGRSAKNTIVLDSPAISRRHALINVQNAGEFWLIDLGSSNGTFLNKRRIHQPVRLNPGDQIAIGDNVFVFQQSAETRPELLTMLAQQTIRQINNVNCWLLVADIENFTPLSQELESNQLAMLIGSWVATCKEIIEKHEGTIDKYLGDGFLAYWREDENSTRNVAAALKQLREAQSRNEPRFRLSLHNGSIAIGGTPSMGEESLLGKEVNFVFRMEKLAGSLGVSWLMSTAAMAKLGSSIQAESIGSHELKGFDGQHEFFSC